MKLGDTSSSADEGLYPIESLADVLSVPLDRIVLWVSQGLLCPVAGDRGVLRFDFRQLSIAQTLRDLSESGADLKELRRSMKRLRRRLPKQSPVKQLVREDARAYLRLDSGDLAEPDGQLFIEFGDDAAPLSLASSVRPTTAGQWFEVGEACEAEGDLRGAIRAYEEGLLAGGPDPKLCFAMAYALAEAGEHARASERYRQVVELDPQNADAWNNLGTVLCDLGDRDAACSAFRRALEIDPHYARTHYNLADTLDEMGLSAEALPHWQSYLRHESTGPWAAHARRRLACAPA